MDNKDKRIAFSVAWKAAVDLIVSGVARPETADLGAEVKDLARMLYEPFAAELAVLDGTANVPPTAQVASTPAPTPAPVAPAAAQGAAVPGGQHPMPPPEPQPAAPAPQGGTDWLMPGEACPDCASNGRNGMKLQNTNMSYRGPEWKCSLKQNKKINGEWAEVGPCSWQDWGRNSRF